MQFDSYFHMDKELERLYIEERYNEMIGILDNAKYMLLDNAFENWEKIRSENNSKARLMNGLPQL